MDFIEDQYERIALMMLLDNAILTAERLFPSKRHSQGISINREHFQERMEARGWPAIKLEVSDDVIRLAFVPNDPVRNAIDAAFGDGATTVAEALEAAGHTGQPDCPACAALNASVAPESPLEERAAHGDA